jgi:hypothetical protein
VLGDIGALILVTRHFVHPDADTLMESRITEAVVRRRKMLPRRLHERAPRAQPYEVSVDGWNCVGEKPQRARRQCVAGRSQRYTSEAPVPGCERFLSFNARRATPL